MVIWIFTATRNVNEQQTSRTACVWLSSILHSIIALKLSLLHALHSWIHNLTALGGI